MSNIELARDWKKEAIVSLLVSLRDWKKPRNIHWRGHSQVWGSISLSFEYETVQPTARSRCCDSRILWKSQGLLYSYTNSVTHWHSRSLNHPFILILT